MKFLAPTREIGYGNVGWLKAFMIRVGESEVILMIFFDVLERDGLDLLLEWSREPA